MKTIGIGFIGAGDIANLHAEAINSLPGAQLVGLSLSLEMMNLIIL